MISFPIEADIAKSNEKKMLIITEIGIINKNIQKSV